MEEKQNRGAGKLDRAFKGFRAAVGISFIFGAAMFYTGFFHGNKLDNAAYLKDDGAERKNWVWTVPEEKWLAQDYEDDS